jgi:membrane protein
MDGRSIRTGTGLQQTTENEFNRKTEASPSIWTLGGLKPRELARRVWREIYEGDLLTRAAALAYYFLFSLFPLLLFLLSMLGYFAERGTELRRDLFGYLARLVPRSAWDLVQKTLDEVTKNAGTGKISFGLLAALWVASSGIAAIGEALNAAYGVKESRPWWRVRLLAMGLTLAIAAIVIGALLLVLFSGQIGEYLAQRFGWGDLFLLLWHLLQWPIVIACMLLSFALIYYFTPDLKEQKWYWITPGSVTAVILWLAVSYILRWYLRFFDRFSVTYGSLGALIVLMLWFYLTGAAILIGGRLNAEIEHAAAKRGAPDAKAEGEKRPGEDEQKAAVSGHSASPSIPEQ